MITQFEKPDEQNEHGQNEFRFDIVEFQRGHFHSAMVVQFALSRNLILFTDWGCWGTIQTLVQMI